MSDESNTETPMLHWLIAGTWSPVKCDTPLVNGGKNVFEGWATFRTWFDYPGGQRVLRCEAVGDYYEILIDGVHLGEAGNRQVSGPRYA